MRKTTVTPADMARQTGRIPAQPGPRDTNGTARSGASVAEGATAPGGSEVRGMASDGATPASGAAAAVVPVVALPPGDAGASGADTDGVIAGAGPVARPGERPTVRLRDGAEDEAPRYAPEWLQLREPADAAARSLDLLDPLRIRLANLPGRAAGGLAIHDLGCGTGSMGRWLAPRLDGAQHWILHDRDPYLLHFAAVASPRAAADGSRVTVETRRGDVARLTPDALVGASLVTASALLDVLTREEIDTLAAACVGAGCPALLTLSVAGRVELSAADPMDAEIAAAFNDHQRHDGLLGPDAVTAAAEAFAERGATVRLNPSPWRLGPDQSALTAQWLRGWVGAAVEERPELAPRAEKYLAARLAACAAGELRVTVHHSDLLALPRPSGGAA
ncbi:hypothetical protein [Streptomyces griseus]|uniref:hypothetical protein n=1 Tax=Streptomyces griseus TaxID=1911 RepID=UPI00056D482E|nr:hypothetical protein [Streptomyces griseus]